MVYSKTVARLPLHCPEGATSFAPKGQHHSPEGRPSLPIRSCSSSSVQERRRRNRRCRSSAWARSRSPYPAPTIRGGRISRAFYEPLRNPLRGAVAPPDIFGLSPPKPKKKRLPGGWGTAQPPLRQPPFAVPRSPYPPLSFSILSLPNLSWVNRWLPFGLPLVNRWLPFGLPSVNRCASSCTSASGIRDL